MITYQQKVLGMIEKAIITHGFEAVDRGMSSSNVSTISVQYHHDIQEVLHIWYNFQLLYFDIQLCRYDARKQKVILASAQYIEPHNSAGFQEFMTKLNQHLKEPK